jgi:hypothetical protein
VPDGSCASNLLGDARQTSRATKCWANPPLRTANTFGAVHGTCLKPRQPRLTDHHIIIHVKHPELHLFPRRAKLWTSAR